MHRLFIAALLPVFAHAADWPQWGGPNRDFRMSAIADVPAWPEAGPKQLWSRDLGDGYSSIVSSGEKIFTMYRKGTQDVVIALDVASGKTLWETPIDAPHVSGMNVEAGPGPHSTPLVAGGRLFVTTVIGHLVSLDLNSGKIVWTHDLWKEFKGSFLERGYSASPLAYRDNIIVPVGGPGRALMAFRQKDGSVVWSKGDFVNAQSSPILIKAGGKDQVISFMAKEVMAANPETGELLWSLPHLTSYDINAATPTWCPEAGTLVVSSAYNGGARGIQVGTEAKELWNHKRLRIHHTNMVCKDGVVYGSSGDFGPAPMTAVDAKTGKVLWQDRAFSKASFILAGDRLFLTDDDGSVAMASISPQGMKVISEAQLLRANSWTVPIVLGTRFIVRDRHKMIALALQ